MVIHEKIVPKKERMNRSTPVSLSTTSVRSDSSQAPPLPFLIQTRCPGQNIPRAIVSRKVPPVIFCVIARLPFTPAAPMSEP